MNKKKPPTFFVHSLSLSLLPAVLALLLFFSFVFFSLRDSIDVWNRHHNESLGETYGSLILSAYTSRGGLEESALQDALAPVLNNKNYLLITDEFRSPVWIYVQGNRITPTPDQSPSEILQAKGISNPSLPRVLLAGTRVFGYLYSGTTGFLDDPANQEFFQNLLSSFFWGAALAFISALLIALIRSSGLSYSIRSITAVLGRENFPLDDLLQIPPPTSEIADLMGAVRRLKTSLQEERLLRRKWNQSIAHDLRTPLSVFRVQIEGIVDGVLQMDKKRGMGLLVQLEHIQSLVEKLRNLTAAEDPDTVYQMGFFDASELFIPLSGAKYSSMLKVEINPKDLKVFGDLHFLRRAVSNMLQNALSHGTEETVLALCEIQSPYRNHENKNFSLMVKNKGQLPKEFGNTLEGKKAITNEQELSKGKGENMGLGLSIIQAITQRHKGVFSLEQRGDYVIAHLILPLPDQHQLMMTETR